MEMQIAVENCKQVTRVDRCAVLALEFGELVEIGFGDGQRKNAQRHHLELLAHRIDLPHFLRREIAHNGAAVRDAPDDSLLLQFEQREPHIAAMGVEALAEILLDQVLARMASETDCLRTEAVGPPRAVRGVLVRRLRVTGSRLADRTAMAVLCRVTLVYNIKNYIVNNLGRP